VYSLIFVLGMMQNSCPSELIGAIILLLEVWTDCGCADLRLGVVYFMYIWCSIICL
jgi:hypothetical protein